MEDGNFPYQVHFLKEEKKQNILTFNLITTELLFHFDSAIIYLTPRVRHSDFISSNTAKNHGTAQATAILTFVTPVEEKCQYKSQLNLNTTITTAEMISSRFSTILLIKDFSYQHNGDPDTASPISGYCAFPFMASQNVCHEKRP